MADVLRHSLTDWVRAVWVKQAAVADSDRDLVERFADHRVEAAFTALFKRHAGMVLQVCRRVLRNTHDAEEACQATFLVYARKAGAIRKRESVGSWLYGVAYRIARSLLARRVREATGQSTEKVCEEDPATEAARREIHVGLDEELMRLPVRYRAPLVLCYLEGLSRDEAACRLGWSAGKLHGSLERGREILRGRLVRRGLGLAAALAASSQAMPATACPVHLALSTLNAAMAFAARQAVTGLISAEVVALSEGVLHTMFKTRLMMTAAVLLAMTMAAAGAGVIASSLNGDRDRDEQGASTLGTEKGRETPKKAQEQPATRALTVQDVARLKTLHVLKGHQKSVWMAAFTPDGQLAATGDELGGIILWEPATGKLRAKLPAHRQMIKALAFSADGKTLLSLSADAVLKRWDLKQAKEIAAVALPIKGLQQAAFTPDGTTLATNKSIVSSNQVKLTGEVEIWDTAKGVMRRKLAGHSEITKQLLFSADGATLVTMGSGIQQGNQGGAVIGMTADSIKVWDFKEGKERASFPVSLVMHIGLSADAKLAALEAGTLDGRFPVQIVDLTKGKATHTLPGHAGIWGSLNAVDFSPDGKIVATSSADKTVKLWDVTTGKELGTLRGHTGWVLRTLFSPQGDLILTLSTDNTIRVWGVPATGKNP